VSRGARATLALVALGGLAALLVLAVTGLPGAGHPAGPNARAVPLLLAHDRQVANAVNGVTYDLRGADTLGEELILFAAALGAAVLLRTAGRPRDAGERRPRTAPSGALRALATVLAAPLIVLGAYVVTHGHLSPGGGFQGGVALSAIVLLVYAAGRQARLRRAGAPEHGAEVVEAAGAAGFALVALGGIVFAGALLANFIAHGSLGSLLSGGTVPLLSLVTGVEVTGAVALIMLEFMEGEW
jgi:multicomponent Na+:H+ antiporter subunit B